MEFLQEHVATKEDLKREMGQLEHKLLDAMDQKNADLKADLVILLRKGDTKLISLISLLKNKQVITEDEARIVLALEPFPQLFGSS